jgi:hypothetical protein
MAVDISTVKEVFIDATFNTSKTNSHLYAIVGQELGYGVPLAFMLMEIRPKEDTRKRAHEAESLQCNENFFRAAKEMGMEPIFVHTDKGWAEINAAKVHLPTENISVLFFLLDLRVDCRIQTFGHTRSLVSVHGMPNTR